MFNITVTADMLEFMEIFLQNMKVQGQYNRSLIENQRIDDWLTALEGATNV